MKAPLYEVKNKLSEYVHIAQNGEPVEICKHDKPAAYLVSCETFESKSDSAARLFKKRLDLLNSRYPVSYGLTDEDVRSMESGRKSDFGYRTVDL
ncbi:MAG: type II toxin-antitoxin system prevent-host-death family antitoxin [Treponemataceae bacterium]|nr:type II toxin-antitoxin system prevent-host-death family antitoxin [Treponemataceae bacterium]